jgi:TBC1 domain family protein 5
MNGVDDEYFKSPERQLIVLNVLFIWQAGHTSTAYRQGMHEIAATLLYVVEQECGAWKANRELIANNTSFIIGNILQPFLSDKYIESTTYWLFERVMRELEMLYDPTQGADGQPAVVRYCTKIQGMYYIYMCLLFY